MRNVVLIIISLVLIISCESEEKLSIDNSFIIDCSGSSSIIKELNITYCSPAPFNQEYILDISDIGKLSFKSNNQIDTLTGKGMKGISIDYLTTSIDIAVKEIEDTLYVCGKKINDTMDCIVYYNTQYDYDCQDDRDFIRSEPDQYALAFNDGDILSDKIVWAQVGMLLKSH
jgi:hypothetical protein